MTFENKESDSNIINICVHEELDTVSISNQKQLNPINKIFYKSSIKMNEIIDSNTVVLFENDLPDNYL